MTKSFFINIPVAIQDSANGEVNRCEAERARSNGVNRHFLTTKVFTSLLALWVVSLKTNSAFQPSIRTRHYYHVGFDLESKLTTEKSTLNGNEYIKG